MSILIAYFGPKNMQLKLFLLYIILEF